MKKLTAFILATILVSVGLAQITMAGYGGGYSNTSTGGGVAGSIAVGTTTVTGGTNGNCLTISAGALGNASCGSGANTTLSNLGVTAINSDLTPGSSYGKSLGSSSLKWLEIDSDYLTLWNQGTNHYVTLNEDANSTDYAWTFPTSMGSSGQVLTSAGVGATPTWSTPSTFNSSSPPPIGATTPNTGAFTSLTLTTPLAVTNGGTGTPSLTGHIKGNGTSAFTASATIPNTDITGLGTMSTQAASSVAITGGTINGAVIGGTTPAAGTFTTATSSSLSNSGTATTANLVVTGTCTGCGTGGSGGGIDFKNIYSRNNLPSNPAVTQIDYSWTSLYIGTNYTAHTSVGTINAGASGTVDRLDTGSLANNTWYYMYGISNGDASAVGGLLSASSSAPTLPSGYTQFRLIGTYRTNGSAQFLNQQQRDMYIWYEVENGGATRVLSAGAATSFTNVSLTSIVPPIAESIQLSASLSVTTLVAPTSFALFIRPGVSSPLTTGIVLAQLTTQVASQLNETSGSTRMNIYPGQISIDYRLDNAPSISGGAYINLLAYYLQI